MVDYTEDVKIIAPYQLKLQDAVSNPQHWVNFVCISNNPITGDPLPYARGLVEISNGVFCRKDIAAYGGALMTASNPDVDYGTGGGCVQIGHGFQRSETWSPPADPPRINLTDDGFHTLYITAGSTIGKPNGADDVLANMRLYDLEVKGAIKSYNNGTWLCSYQGGGGGGNNGGIALDTYGNAKFQGGGSSNSWHIFNTNGYDLFSIRNNPNGASYGNIDIHLNPYQDRTWALGGGGNRWAGIAVWNVYYANLYDSWDTVDDLAYAKQFKAVTITENGKQRQVIDPTTLTLFNADYQPDVVGRDNPKIAEMHDLHKVVGFMLSCQKAVALKLEEHDTNFAEVAKLKDEIAGLRTQIQGLTGKIGA